MMGLRGTLAVEMVGLTLSMVSLILSLFIFCHFRNLWSTQTRLRKNLFIALGIQIIVRLIIAVHQLLRVASSAHHELILEPPSPNNMKLQDSDTETELLRMNGVNHKNLHSCETFFPVFLLEYTRNAMFMWMFLEGLYLHSMITVFPIIHERLSLKFYYCMGWASPILLTFIWVMMAAEKENGRICWRSYMFTSYFWILEGPKLTIILMNLFFLLNVIRILVTKLWSSNSLEVNQVRKAVSRSIVLVPLLGITNYLHLQMRHSPLDKEFTTWSYSTAFVTSFQGVFAALIYCFLTGEVQVTVRRWQIERRNEQREIIMVNGGPAGNCSISSITAPNARVSNHNNNGRKSSGESNVVVFNWNQNPKVEGAEGNSGGLLKIESSGRIEGDDDDTLNPTLSAASSTSILDPFKEHWNEVDLSAHCNVDIEHIEIPVDYFTLYNDKKLKDNVAPPNRAGSTSSSANLVEIEKDENCSNVEMNANT